MYFDSEQKKRLRRKGERRKMKAYVTVKDVVLVLPVKDTQAREILRNLRKQKDKKGEIFEGSYRALCLERFLQFPLQYLLSIFLRLKVRLMTFGRNK